MNESGEWDLYYVDDATVEQHNLGTWLSGCNSIGKPHDLHVNYYPDIELWHRVEDKSILPTTNLVELGFVKCVKVKCVTYDQLVAAYQIGKVDIIKIDTEGYDCFIVNSILDFYEDKKEQSPNRIVFESNSHVPKDQVLQVKRRLLDFNYNIRSTNHDTYAEKIA